MVGLERWEVLLLVVTELHLEVVFAGSLGFLVKLFIIINHVPSTPFNQSTSRIA